MTRLKDKEGLLKAAREKQKLPTREHKLDCYLTNPQKHYRPEGSGEKYSR